MAEATLNNQGSPLEILKKYQPLMVPIGFMGLIGIIVVPMSPLAMDLLIALNVAIATVILLTTLFVKKALEFSVFPSLLLGTTLFRLVLNIATTRMILSMDATTPEGASNAAGQVIASFASFVAGNSLVVGVVMFAILIIVQFVVITKGATRISEVGARFTLDAMPGKQMAIDADLNAGLIDESEARTRREEISSEADFYGAMDGAAKFVRGDAVAGIIITVVNIVGGFAVGVLEKDWTATQSMEIFTRLTIGDGLVSQLPAFVISLAAGLIVTRSGGKQNLGAELTDQMTSQAPALGLAAGFLVLMAFTGLPALPMLAIAAGLGGGAFLITRNAKEQLVAAEQKVQQAQQEKAEEPAPVEASLALDTLELEVGYSLVRLIDKGQGGDLLDRISMIRRQLAEEMGLVMPPVRIRDNMQLDPHEYRLKIRGNTIASGQVYPEQFLVMESGFETNSIDLPGIHTVEPAFGLPAMWVEGSQKQRAENAGYTVVDASSVLATHLTEMVRSHAAELISREETNNLIIQLKERAPKLTEEVLGEEKGIIKPGELQRVLQNLLSERIPIRDMESIVETLGDWASKTRDLEILTEYVRNGLKRTICQQYAMEEMVENPNEPSMTPRPVQRLYCVSMDPALEDKINSFIDRSGDGTTMSLPPVLANQIVQAVAEESAKLSNTGRQPVVLTSPQVRAQVRKLIEPHLPAAAVLGYNEIATGVEVESLGLVQVRADG